jgi:hypothetical protein
VLRSLPRLGWPLWNICVTNDHGYIPLVVNTSRSFPRSWLITGFITRLTRRVSLVEQELLTLPEHMSSPPVFSGVRVTRSLVFYIYMFCWSLFVLMKTDQTDAIRNQSCYENLKRQWLPNRRLSARTVRNRLKSAGLKSWRVNKRPMVSNRYQRYA